MDWQITSAVLSAVAAVLSIAELIYRHAQIKNFAAPNILVKISDIVVRWGCLQFCGQRQARLYKKVQSVRCSEQTFKAY